MATAQIGLHHNLAQFYQHGLGLPAQFGFGVCGVANRQLHFGRTVKLGVDAHDGFAGGDINGGFVFFFAFKVHRNARAFECDAHKVAHGLGSAGGQQKGVGLIGLQYAPEGDRAGAG